VSVFVSRSFVITVRQGGAGHLHGARLRLEERPELLKGGTTAVLWAILDSIVDDYAPVIEGLEGDIEEVEATVFTGAVAPTERDVLGTVLQANMAVISNQQNEISVRQNETVKRLTLVATIFLPLTFITGFFGMNFGWLTGHIASFWVFAVYGIGSLVASCAGLYLWFRHSGHIGST
jgi:magnesium transporter